MIHVTLAEIREYEKNPLQRIGQAIINDNAKPASLMLRDEMDTRQKIFNVENKDFYRVAKETGYVVIDP
jgi:hypothetical protein